MKGIIARLRASPRISKGATLTAVMALMAIGGIAYCGATISASAKKRDACHAQCEKGKSPCAKYSDAVKRLHCVQKCLSHCNAR